MRQEFKGKSAHRNVLVRLGQLSADPTTIVIGRGCEAKLNEEEIHWVEWRENYELKHEIGRIIASRQMNLKGIDAATDDIFNLIGRL
jgi:hypothetical protein